MGSHSELADANVSAVPPGSTSASSGWRFALSLFVLAGAVAVTAIAGAAGAMAYGAVVQALPRLTVKVFT